MGKATASLRHRLGTITYRSGLEPDPLESLEWVPHPAIRARDKVAAALRAEPGQGRNEERRRNDT